MMTGRAAQMPPVYLFVVRLDMQCEGNAMTALGQDDLSST